MRDRDANRQRFLDLLFSPPMKPMSLPSDSLTPAPFKNVLAAGFKVFSSQLFLSELQGIAASPSIRKIVLHWQNMIDMFISGKKAQVLGCYTHVHTSQLVLRVDPSEMLQFFSTVEADNACIDAARNQSTARFGGADWHSADYEELTNPATSQAALHRVLKHILPESHCTPLIRTTWGRKQNLGRHNLSISNFAEVYDVLKGTPRYLAMLREGMC